MKLTDLDIRKALYKDILAKIKKQYPETKIIEELGIYQGYVRIDLVAINGYMYGFEIKSECDDLRRLPIQIKYYSKILDNITIVIGKRHLEKVKKIIPEWWGIIVAEKYSKENILLLQERPSKFNHQIDSNILVQLLWKDEAIKILKENKLYNGLSKKPRNFLWKKLANELSLPQLQSYVRSNLISRRNWRINESVLSQM
jgi:hypothetical protein